MVTPVSIQTRHPVPDQPYRDVVEPLGETDPLAPPIAEGSTVRRPGSGRRRQLVIAGAGLVSVAVLAFLAWTWRHPSAFDDYAANEVSYSRGDVGETTYVGITLPNDQIRVLSGARLVVGQAAEAKMAAGRSG